jgi:hypothetical protein
MKLLRITAIACVLSLGITNTSQAQYSEGCLALQQCVDTALPTSLLTCQTSNPTCDLNSFSSNKTLERFAVTSGEVADRAIEIEKCSTTTTKESCNRCYQKAKKPLAKRYYGKLFRGLLGNATSLIEAERKSKCSVLPKVALK